MNSVVLLLVTVTVVLFATAAVVARSVYAVPDLKVGVVYRRFGRSHPDDRFRVRLHGSPGPQAALLQPNRRYVRPPWLYRVRYTDMVYVPEGTVGLVQARAGLVRPPGRLLGRHVECDYFQDGERFLRDGGEQGRQPDVLPGGAYYAINPELFTVSTVDTIGTGRADGITANQLREVRVPIGYTGVVIVRDGEPASDEPDGLGPVVPGHHTFRLPWVFLAGGGRRGVQQETLDAGTYSINPWFAQVVLVPTGDLYLEWSQRSAKSPGSLDAALDQIAVTIQGHRLTLQMSQTLRTPPEAAPRLVRRFGEEAAGDPAAAEPAIASKPVQRFVERVLGSAVSGYFMGVVGQYTAVEFIMRYHEIRLELEDHVRQALADWGVAAGQTVLADLVAEDPGLGELLQQLTAASAKGAVLRQQMSNAELESRLERWRIELDSERGVAQLRKQIEVLGADQVALERVVNLISGMPVTSYQGNADVAEVLHLLPPSAARELLDALLRHNRLEPTDTGRALGAGPEPAGNRAEPADEPAPPRQDPPAGDAASPGQPSGDRA
jgi:hypothetical protein